MDRHKNKENEMENPTTHTFNPSGNPIEITIENIQKVLQENTPQSVQKEVRNFLTGILTGDILKYYGYEFIEATVSLSVKGHHLLYLKWHHPDHDKKLVHSCILMDYLSILRYSPAYKESLLNFAWASPNTLCLSLVTESYLNGIKAKLIPAQSRQNKEK